MKLLEYKGKELLKKSAIKIPPGIVVDNKSYINLSYHKEKYKEFFLDTKKVIIKAQIPSGKRKQNNLIAITANYEESLKIIDEMYKKSFNSALISTLLIEKAMEIKEEYFLAIRYDTKSRIPIIIFSKQGGMDIEEIFKTKKPIMKEISLLRGLSLYQAREIVKEAGFEKEDLIKLANFIKKAFDCFDYYDCKSLEINPIINTTDNILYAGDAKIEIDDNAIAKHELFNDITEDKTILNEREIEARKIDLNDYRGVAGKSFIDLNGDIAVLASGGGASLVCMDAMIEAGAKPANYTEYSGNPSKEKVKKLTEITLSKPNLNGCLVIGGTANFTDIYETLSGFIDGLKTINPKPQYPIVIRRAGPNDKKAFEMIREFAEKEKYDIATFDENTPMTKAVKIIVEKVKNYKNEHTNR